jgi:hypothetical protein
VCYRQAPAGGAQVRQAASNVSVPLCDLLIFESLKKMIIKTPISVGELLDKITILQIKSQYSNNSYILKELQDLTEIAKEHQVYDEQDLQSLKEVNEKLWVIEDEIRQLEKQQDFSFTFIELARQVYITNDQRALIKKQINERTNSTYSEVKLH